MFLMHHSTPTRALSLVVRQCFQYKPVVNRQYCHIILYLIIMKKNAIFYQLKSSIVYLRMLCSVNGPNCLLLREVIHINGIFYVSFFLFFLLNIFDAVCTATVQLYNHHYLNLTEKHLR